MAREAVAQPLARPTGARIRRDWSARTRGTPLDALRYTKFVTVMKRALPITAAAIVAAVIAYAVIPRQSDRMSMSFERMGRLDNDLAMIKPRLSGSDAKGNPFVVTADAAIQDPKNVHRARLKNVEADMTLDRQGWLNATAADGYFDMDAGTLRLVGGIAVFSDTGYELHTASGHVDLRKGIFRGPDEVTGQGPMGGLRADRFEVDRFSRQIRLNGHVRMTMYVKKSARK